MWPDRTFVSDQSTVMINSTENSNVTCMLRSELSLQIYDLGMHDDLTSSRANFKKKVS